MWMSNSLRYLVLKTDISVITNKHMSYRGILYWILSINDLKERCIHRKEEEYDEKQSSGVQSCFVRCYFPVPINAEEPLSLCQMMSLFPYNGPLRKLCKGKNCLLQHCNGYFCIWCLYDTTILNSCRYV